jgi:hypothetical protein
MAWFPLLVVNSSGFGIGLVLRLEDPARFPLALLPQCLRVSHGALGATRVPRRPALI